MDINIHCTMTSDTLREASERERERERERKREGEGERKQGEERGRDAGESFSVLWDTIIYLSSWWKVPVHIIDLLLETCTPEKIYD